MSDLFGYLYAAAVGMGGVLGYLRTGSMASLASGLFFGGLMVVAANRTSVQPADAKLATRTSCGIGITGVVVSLALFLLMGWRFSTSYKFMPAGLVALLRHPLPSKFIGVVPS
jgi:uncharacterized membrane protein (UPF0136 family)